MPEAVYHVGGCGHAVEFPEPPKGYVPEPDRHGNIHMRGACSGCGERCKRIIPQMAGRAHLPVGFEYASRIEWTVPL